MTCHHEFFTLIIEPKKGSKMLLLLVPILCFACHVRLLLFVALIFLSFASPILEIPLLLIMVLK